MQNMLYEPVFLKKDIKLKKTPNDDISFGQIKNLTKDSKNVLSGIIHSSTQFQFKSILSLKLKRSLTNTTSHDELKKGFKLKVS